MTAVHTGSADETMALAAVVAGHLRPGDVILLTGDLGAGKTTFTKGLASALGVTDPVTSPTFTLLRTYPVPGAGKVPEDDGRVSALVHADLYRLDRLREVTDLAIGEMLEDGAAAVVEWGEAALPVLGRDALVISISHGTGSDDRSLSFCPTGTWRERWADLAVRLERWP